MVYHLQITALIFGGFLRCFVLFAIFKGGYFVRKFIFSQELGDALRKLSYLIPFKFLGELVLGFDIIWLVLRAEKYEMNLSI